MRVCVSCFVLLYDTTENFLSPPKKKRVKKKKKRGVCCSRNNFVGFVVGLFFFFFFFCWCCGIGKRERERERESILLCPKRVSCFEHHTLVVLCARRHSITTVRFDDDDETLRTMTTTTTTTRRSVACVVSLRRRRRRRRRDHQNARGVETLAASMQRRHEEKKDRHQHHRHHQNRRRSSACFPSSKRPFARNEPTTRKRKRCGRGKNGRWSILCANFTKRSQTGRKRRLCFERIRRLLGARLVVRRNEDTLLAVAIISTDCATAGVIESVMVDEASCGGDAAYIDNVKRFLIQSASRRLYNADNICDLSER